MAIAMAPATLSSASDPGQSVPFFASASHAPEREGFVRVVNHSDIPGQVVIEAIDDDGVSYEPVTLTLGASETAHFNSVDLEDGNVDKGLVGSTGPGQGDWRLELTTDVDIEVLAYMRTSSGFLTSMHDTVPWRDGGYQVATFNPGSNRNQRSLLRVVNLGEADATVTISGVDDAGAAPANPVTVDVPAGGARTYTAAELESGNAPGLSGSLGDGAGKWQLTVGSDQPLTVMSLLASPSGQLTNLSSDGSDTSTITFDFHRGDPGFVADYADLPQDDQDIYELMSDYRPLPSPLASKSALYLSGVNRSDDLFMFFKGQVGGLVPGARYGVSVSVEIATDTPAGCIGVGGAPGESVWIKAGVTDVEPVPVVEGTYLRMNIDIGNQSNSGEQAVVLGDMANSRACEESRRWELKAFPARSIPAQVSASATGRAWLMFGTDSGFESRTEVYFTRASATFTPR